MSERIRARDNLPSNASGECASEAHEDVDVFPKKGVRESSAGLPPATIPSRLPSSLAHPSNRLTLQLNENWRIVDDPLQWILQRRKGNPRKRNSGWQDRSFCTTREGLLRCVRENCGEVDDDALTKLQVLPEFHADWEPSR
jgi:hypothetical protein